MEIVVYLTKWTADIKKIKKQNNEWTDVIVCNNNNSFISNLES